MATVNRNSSTLDKLGWYLGHREHTAWDKFSADDRQQMIEEDLLAGRSVSLVLVALISTGLLLSIVSLLVVIATAS
jgi:hypothetical protein